MRKLRFFRCGFYVSLIVWICGVYIPMFMDVSAWIKIAVILITLSNYIFFTIGKSVVEKELRQKK